MQITRRRLKEIIKEEMDHLAETGDLEALTESEKMAFQIILEKLSPEELQEMGLTRIDEQPDAQQKKRHKDMHADYDKKIKDLKDQIARLKKQTPAGASVTSNSRTGRPVSTGPATSPKRPAITRARPPSKTAAGISAAATSW